MSANGQLFISAQTGGRMAWREDELHYILGCKTPTQLFGVLREESLRLGMGNVAIGLVLPIPLDQKKFVLFNDYPSEWKERYADKGFLSIDPTVKHGLRSVLPILWSDPELHQPECAAFWEEARSAGLTHGIAQPVWDRHGSCSMLSFSRGHLEFSRHELREKLPKIAWLAQLAHTALAGMVIDKEIPEAKVKLSEREKEVLRRTANGLSSTQIAEKLNLSPRTLDWHFLNAMSKLGVSHRSQAALIAHKLGLLDD
jgi:LuxR family quorum-sensing system transcriptional regulator SolR